MNVSELISCTATELSLSVDNVMVWALILRRIDVPPRQQRAVLAAGVAIAFAVRFVAIMAGAAALERMAWLTYVLGAVLIWTAWKVFRSGDEQEGDSRIIRWASRLGSPAIAAVVALGAIDVVFAVDSIPASFGITLDPVTIISANAVALAALWFLYRVVSVLMDRLAYLSHGLAVILAWIGVGMVGHDVVSVPQLVNLAVIVVVLAATAAVSLLRTRA